VSEKLFIILLFLGLWPRKSKILFMPYKKEVVSVDKFSKLKLAPVYAYLGFDF
jgi:hypothetical protein